MSLLERMLGSSPDSEIDPVIDRLVAATDKRLALVKGYRQRLREPVLAARERMRAAVARIPGPTPVTARTWSEDDTVRALFAHRDEVDAAFSHDEGVREYFMMHPAADCIALLGLEQREKRVLAAAMAGDAVQTEVARTTVSFAEPVILAPGADEARVREELAVRALEFLALRALERVGTLRAQRHELEKEQALIRAKLKLAQRRGIGFGSLAGRGESRAELEQDLERTVQELEGAASKQLLPALLDELVAVFTAPDDLLSISSSTLALDAMNFVVEASPQAVVPRVATLRLWQRNPYAVLLARFPNAELKADNRLAEAEKFL